MQFRINNISVESILSVVQETYDINFLLGD